MLKYLILVLVILMPIMALFSQTNIKSKIKDSEGKIAKQSFYDFSAKSITGKDISMSDYKGKVVVVVNVASKCGFTPQYEGLQELYQNHKEEGLVILGFPSNQFANQEPGSNEDIADFCTLNYGVTFPMFSKIDVNGKDAHPLYQFMKSQQSGFPGDAIKWNFTKFLIDKEGNVVERFASTTKPESMEKDILRLLK